MIHQQMIQTEIGHRYRFNLRPYVIWKYALPHRLLFLDRHISYPDCRPTDIKGETNVENDKRSERRSFSRFIYIVLRCHISDRINHWLFY